VRAVLKTQDILPRLRVARRTETGWRALCPAHDDQKASLSIAEGEGGKVLLHCHVGCSFQEVIAALGKEVATALDTKPKNVAKSGVGSKPSTDDTWRWWIEKTGIPAERWQANEVDVVDGRVRFSFPFHVRKLRPKGGSYYWEHPEGIPIPPRWPVPDGELPGSIVLCEGETDCATLRYCGYKAYGVTKGARTPPSVEAFRALREKGLREVIVLFDSDDAGREGASELAKNAVLAGLKVHIAKLPDWLALVGGKDVNHLWHYHHHDHEAFVETIDRCLKRGVPFDQSSQPIYSDLIDRKPVTIQ